MRKLALALAVAMSAAVMACTTSPTPIVALGSWGGSHVSMEVTSEGARLEYDCAVGVIDEPTIGIDTPADYAAFVKRWKTQPV